MGCSRFAEDRKNGDSLLDFGGGGLVVDVKALVVVLLGEVVVVVVVIWVRPRSAGKGSTGGDEAWLWLDGYPAEERSGTDWHASSRRDPKYVTSDSGGLGGIQKVWRL